jgi:hypothetical protein
VFKNINITKEITSESSKYNNFIAAYLCTSGSLSDWESLYLDFYNLPSFLSTFRKWIESFNWVEIFFSCTWDSSKYVNPSILQSTWGVIIATKIQIRLVKPNIHINIVVFNRAWCIVLIKSWSCDDKEFVFQTCYWMSMTWGFEWIFCYAFKLLGTVVYNLITCSERLQISLSEISTSNNEQSLTWCLTILKVMLKICILLNQVFCYLVFR